MSTTPPLPGWHARAHPHPHPASFTPTRDTLLFAVLRSAPADPEGFTLALFRPNVAVDAVGRVLVLEEQDVRAFEGLASRLCALPETGTYRNTWRVKRDRTSQPIERVLLPGGEELKEVGVQGYEVGDRNEVKDPVGEVVVVPEVLGELVELAREAREGYKRGEEAEVVKDVKAVIGV